MEYGAGLPIPEPLVEALRCLRAPTPNPLLDHNAITHLPAYGGAYALALLLDREIEVRRGRKTETINPGWYVYAGNANGPGGIRARLARHLRQDKPVRWHIDQLTIKAGYRAGLPVPGGDECAIVTQLLGTACFAPSSPGFGSSDCSKCVSHLLRYCA